MIDDTTKAVRLSIDLHEHLIQVPSPQSEPMHTIDALAFDS